MKKNDLFMSAVFVVGVLVATFVVCKAQADNIGIAHNDDVSRITYQSLTREDTHKFYINADIVNADTDRTKVATRLLGHIELSGFHVSAMGTFATGYNQTLVGVGYDFLDTQLLGFDVGRRRDGDNALFGYWGVGNKHFSSDGFIDTNAKTYSGRGNILYNVNKTLKVGYELGVINDMPLHSLRFKVSL